MFLPKIRLGLILFWGKHGISEKSSGQVTNYLTEPEFKPLCLLRPLSLQFSNRNIVEIELAECLM